MPNFEREDALCKLSDCLVDGMDLDAMRQLAFEHIFHALEQESDADLINRLIEMNLYQENENA